MTHQVNIRMEAKTRDKLKRLWLRIKSVDPSTTQGDTLETALTYLEEKLDGKVIAREVIDA